MVYKDVRYSVADWDTIRSLGWGAFIGTGRQLYGGSSLEFGLWQNNPHWSKGAAIQPPCQWWIVERLSIAWPAVIVADSFAWGPLYEGNDKNIWDVLETKCKHLKILYLQDLDGKCFEEYDNGAPETTPVDSSVDRDALVAPKPHYGTGSSSVDGLLCPG